MSPVKGAVRLDPGLETLAGRLAIIDTRCVLATVIRATGSTYSKPGARMLIEADGRITGQLSGGCLEQDLRGHAAAVLATGIARAVSYDMRADNDLVFGIGAGCEGCLEVLLEPVAGRESRAGKALQLAGERSRDGASMTLIVIHAGPEHLLGTHLWQGPGTADLPPPLADACSFSMAYPRPRELRWADASGAQAAWVQPVLPLPAILICGAGPDAMPLAAALRALHYPVTITDHRPAYANAGNFPEAAVMLGPAATLASRLHLPGFFAAVVMSHHLASDADYLRALAASEMIYLGVLGPRARRRRLLAELGAYAAAVEGRLRGPIGLDIGAVTPEGIALAIAAEIHAVAASHNALAFKHGISLAADAETPPSVRQGSVT